MNTDFHYYATYVAALLAGFSHEESVRIGYCAELTDNCTKTFLSKLHAPREAATSQLRMEMMDARTDFIGVCDITRIWASFHFLPYDLYAQKPHCSKAYLDKYRLICGPNSALLAESVELARGKGIEAMGMCMHIVADTWAHRYFAGTVSLVINNTNDSFRELLNEDGTKTRPITFVHSPGRPDDLEAAQYTTTMFVMSENSVMNLGHGRAGYVPDYSFLRYRYMPSWANYAEVEKDNPSDFYHAFTQMVYTLRYLSGQSNTFELDHYDTETIEPYRDRIMAILKHRQSEDDACLEWKAFGESLSGQTIPDFSLDTYRAEYLRAAENEKNDTVLGRYILAVLAQKSMVTNRIHISGNRLAGRSVNYSEKGLRGLRDYWALVFSNEEDDAP